MMMARAVGVVVTARKRSLRRDAAGREEADGQAADGEAPAQRGADVPKFG